MPWNAFKLAVWNTDLEIPTSDLQLNAPQVTIIIIIIIIIIVIIF